MSSSPTEGRWAERRAGDCRIFVGDGLFDKDFVTIVDHLVSRLPQSRTEYDADNSLSIKHLTHRWDLQDLAAHPVFRGVLKPVVAAVERIYAEFDPILNRAHANDHPYGDVQSAHQDLCPGITALY